MMLPFSEICFDNGAEALELVTKAQQSGDYILDLSSVARVDSAAIALVLEAERLAKAKRQEILLEHVPPSFSKLEALYGLKEIIGPLRR